MTSAPNCDGELMSVDQSGPILDDAPKAVLPINIGPEIQPAGRLVKADGRGLSNESSGQRDALPLVFTQLGHIPETIP